MAQGGKRSKCYHDQADNPEAPKQYRPINLMQGNRHEKAQGQQEQALNSDYYPAPSNSKEERECRTREQKLHSEDKQSRLDSRLLCVIRNGKNRMRYRQSNKSP